MINDADVSTMSVFYELFPGISEKEESRCFAAACCHCLWDVNDGPAIPMEEVIGKMLRTSATASDSLKKRVWKMLDTRWDESGYLLTQISRMVKLLKSKGYVIDSYSLYADLMNWDRDRRTVQKKWINIIINNKEGMEDVD